MSSYIGVPYFQDAELTVVKNRLTTAENTIVANKSTYDTKVAQIDSTTGNHETRLVTAEGKISQIETNITVQVSQAISTQVAQVTFDSLKQELTENTQGDLARALADAVAETVQNSVIDSKVAQVAYDADKATQGVTNTGFDTKLQALEEFINVFLAANVLKYNDNTQTYTYTGSSQSIALVAGAPTPTDQLTITNATIDSNYLLTFTVTSNVDFVPGPVFVRAASSVYNAQVLDADMNPRYSFPTGEPVICKAQFEQNPESLSFMLTKSGTTISNMFTPAAPSGSYPITITGFAKDSNGRTTVTFTVTDASSFSPANQLYIGELRATQTTVNTGNVTSQFLGYFPDMNPFVPTSGSSYTFATSDPLNNYVNNGANVLSDIHLRLGSGQQVSAFYNGDYSSGV